MYAGKDPKKIDEINSKIREHNEPEGTIPTIQGAGVICMDLLTERFLIVKDIWGRYGFPKGQLKSKEKYIDCAFRELKEETGISYQMKIAGFIIIKRKVYFIVFIKEFELDKAKIVSKHEITDICWANIYDLDPMKTNMSIKQFIKFSDHLSKLIKEAPYYNKEKIKIRKELISKPFWRD